MLRVVLFACLALYAAAFTAPVGSRAVVASRTSDATMAAAKKKGVNPALFSSGIKAKTTARGGGRKPLKGDGSGRRNDGSTIFNKPWEASSKANIAKSRGLVLSARWGSKDRPGAPKNYLQGGRAKK